MLSLAHIYQDDSLLFPHINFLVDIQIEFWLHVPFSVGGVLKCYRSPQWMSMNATGGISVRYYQSFICAPILWQHKYADFSLKAPPKSSQPNGEISHCICHHFVSTCLSAIEEKWVVSTKHYGSTEGTATHWFPVDESIMLFPKPNVHREKGSGRYKKKKK